MSGKKYKSISKSQQIRNLLKDGMDTAAIAKRLNVTKQYVYVVRHEEKLRNAKQKQKVRQFKVKSDPKAKAWSKKNAWFGVDEEKTAAALEMHHILVNKNRLNPRSNKYWEAVDKWSKEYDRVRGRLDRRVRELEKQSKLAKAVKQTKEEIEPITRKDMLEELKPGLNELFGLDLPPATPDLVNKPPHYTAGGIDFLDFAEAKGLTENAYLFNVVKYVARCGKKEGVDPVQDLEKAEFYLKREIARRKRA